MIAPYSPLVGIDGGYYYPMPYSAPLLADSLRNGLIPLGLLATLSVASTLALIVFIMSRIITWRRHYRTFVGYNQYVILVLNLLIAGRPGCDGARVTDSLLTETTDLQQGFSFFISWHWYHQEMILAPSPACFAQGWMLHSGDLGSGFFVLAIAVHSYYMAVYGRHLGQKTFIGVIVSIWILVYLLTAIGVCLHGKRYFVRAGAWCWVSSAYEPYRLWCHYIWVFIVEFSTIAIYLLTFWSLRQKSRQFLINGHIQADHPGAASIRAVNRIAMLMTLYPCVYVLLTLPLSASRMWSMNNNGRPTSDTYSIIAGSLLTSCGWVDSLLYTLTRKRLLQDSMPSDASQRDVGVDSNFLELERKGITHTRTVTVEDDWVDFETTTVGHEITPRRARVLGTPFKKIASPTESTEPILMGMCMPGAHAGEVTTEITGGPRSCSTDEKIQNSKLSSVSRHASGETRCTD